MLKLLDQFFGEVWNIGRDFIKETVKAYQEAPGRPESETARMIRVKAANDAKFKYILDNDLCKCHKCKERRAREKVLEQLTQEAQEMGLYD